MTMIQNPYMFDPYTKMLLHTRGADESTSFLDASPSNHTMTAQADAQIDTAVADPWGGNAGVMMLDGIGDYVSALDSADWNFAAGNWTVEGRFRFNSTSGIYPMIGQSEDSSKVVQFQYDATNNKLGFFADAAIPPDAIYEVDWTASADIWYHIAWVRSGTSIYCFIDGVAQSLTVSIAIGSGALPDLTSPLQIGYNIPYGFGGAEYFSGYIAEVRVSKGIARWTANFTPPTKPYN